MTYRLVLRRILGIVCWLTAHLSLAQANAELVLTLDSCLVLAEQNYPQIAQYDLLARATEYTVDNAQKGKLPQLLLAGQATYQSDVTSVPGSDMVGIPTVSKDQYKLYGEVVQPLTGLAVINQQQKVIKAQGMVDEARLQTQIYPIKQRVSDLFFGSLLISGQLQQTRLAMDDLQAGIQIAEASVEFGTALKTTVNVLKAEYLTIEQRFVEQEALRKSYRDMLGRFIARDLPANVRLVLPGAQAISDEIRRPELNLFNAQLTAIDLQSDLIDKGNLPMFSLFVQSGVGRPALNFLSNDLDPYYLGGLRLSWNIANYYTAGKQKEIYSLNQEIVFSERETFLFNTRLSLANQSNQIAKIQQILEKDGEILTLREEIVQTAQGQLENGVITANDYKQLVSDADRARQNQVIHEIELLRLQNEYQLIAGN